MVGFLPVDLKDDLSFELYNPHCPVLRFTCQQERPFNVGDRWGGDICKLVSKDLGYKITLFSKELGDNLIHTGNKTSLKSLTFVALSG